MIFLFISTNLFYHVNCAIGWKILGCAVILLISLKYEIYQFLGGAFFAPQMPRAIILTLEALYGAFLILFFLLLLFDLYLLGNWLLAKAGMPTPQHLPIIPIKCCLVLLAVALGIYGTYEAVKVPEVREIHLTLDQLPPELNELRLVQISDIHVGPLQGREWLAQVVAKANELQADLILLTGDYVDGTVDKIGSELEPLAHLQAKYGVLAVHGNHEYYWYMPQWRKVITSLGVDLLENEHRAIDINGQTLVVAGLTDRVAKKFGLPEPDLNGALAAAPHAPTILLSHQPHEATEYAKQVDVILSGHTHGGIMFFLQPLIARFNSGFVMGEYPLNDRKLYVSPGTGLWNGFSCRIGVPSEITLFILNSQQKGEIEQLDGER